jgi:hypothetical protein
VAGGAASAVNGQSNNQLHAPQRTTANARPAPHVTSAGYHNDQSNKAPPAKPIAQPMPPPPHAESTPEPLITTHSIPAAVAFTRLSRDGTPVAPFNPQAGNFSPLTSNKSDKVDYNKSARVYKSNVQQTKTPFNNSDAQNRMPPFPAGGPGPGNRMVGCPPGHQAYNPSLHGRSNSGPSALGAKRDAQGQYVRYVSPSMSIQAMANFEVVMRDGRQTKLNHPETLESKEQSILSTIKKVHLDLRCAGRLRKLRLVGN